MSVDGFSMSSLGMPKDITSAQAAATAEQVVQMGNEKVVGKIDRALNKKINNDEEKERNKNQYFEDGYESSEDENQEDDESGVNKDEKLSLKNAKKYQNISIKDPENVIIRINDKNDKIELYNKATKKIIESIKADDFLDMMNNLDYNSGILANFKI